MLKKILIFILSFALMMPILAGCSLITDNNEKDSLRVIATISAISDSGNDKHVLNDAGYYVYNPSPAFLTANAGHAVYTASTDIFEKGGFFYIYRNGVYEDVYDLTLADLVKKTESWSVQTEKKEIYKYQLFSYINNYGNEYMQNYGYTLEQLVETFVDMLITREVSLVEAERYIEKGEIILDVAFENSVKRGIYEQIDSQYRSYLNEVLKDNGIEVPGEEEESTDNNNNLVGNEIGTIVGNESNDGVTDPTYPSYPYDPVEEDAEEEVWDINSPKRAAKWPGMLGSVETKSRELEAMSRLIRAFENTIKEDFRLTDKKRKELLKDFDTIRNVINVQGLERVYPMLGEMAFIEYLVGRSVREEKKINLLQDYIVGEIEATDDEILNEYNRLIRLQTEMYTEDLSAYYSASGEKLMLVNPDPTKHIYVKHLLVQFTDEQKAELEAYKSTPGATVEGYEALRAQLATQIVGYKHVDGEDDLANPLSISTISNIIRSQMAAAANARDAERTFDRLIYTYNQDPGIFGNALGYAVINELVGEETDQFVPEFSQGARDLRNEENEDGSKKYKIGDLLDYNVITDHGVHFMYYSYQRPSTTPLLSDYVTAGEYETYRDLIEEAVKGNKTETKFEDWQSAIIRDYKEITKKVTIYEKAFKDIYK